MANIATPAPRRSNLVLWSLAVLGVGLLSILPLSVLKSPFGTNPSAPAGVFDRIRVAYFEFGPEADTLWLANPTSPSDRIRSLTIRHAPEYGVIPSLSPDSRRFVFTVLPPETPAPGPDAPAQLWSASLADSSTTLLAEDVDLLVKPVWSPDGRSVTFRRSRESDGLSRLFSVPASGGPEKLLASSQEALFPVGHSQAGERFYFVGLGDAGSSLYQTDMASRQQTLVTTISGSITRDWTLSPDASRLAFLEMTFGAQTYSAQAFVLDIATGSLTAVGSPESNAFSPQWTKDGSLVVGQLTPDGKSTPLTLVPATGPSSTLAAPDRGFDVPLAANTQAGVAVTSFDGSSVINPGRASLVVVGADGVRREITTREVTFLGWITP